MTWCIMETLCRPLEANQPLSFQGQTLILPTISIGSVPQLCVDLLIHARGWKCRRVAYLDSTDCVPFVAPSEDGTANEILTSLDGR